MVLIRENKEFPCRIAAERSDSIIDGQIPAPDLLQHDRQHDDIVNRRILKQINLKTAPPAIPSHIPSLQTERRSHALLATEAQCSPDGERRSCRGRGSGKRRSRSGERRRSRRLCISGLRSRYRPADSVPSRSAATKWNTEQDRQTSNLTITEDSESESEGDKHVSK